MKDGVERFGEETRARAVCGRNGCGAGRRRKPSPPPSSAERRARTVILATGADPRPPGVPHEDELRGRGVAYCATRDGMLNRGKTVFVVGGGNSGGGGMRCSVPRAKGCIWCTGRRAHPPPKATGRRCKRLKTWNSSELPCGGAAVRLRGDGRCAGRCGERQPFGTGLATACSSRWDAFQTTGCFTACCRWTRRDILSRTRPRAMALPGVFAVGDAHEAYAADHHSGGGRRCGLQI